MKKFIFIVWSSEFWSGLWLFAKIFALTFLASVVAAAILVIIFTLLPLDRILLSVVLLGILSLVYLVKE